MEEQVISMARGIERGSNVVSFTRPQEVLISGNNALKLDVYTNFQPQETGQVIDFEGEKTRRTEKKKVLVYDPDFDRRDYRVFDILSKEEQQELIAYTNRQIETFIGERLRVAESETRWNIVEGKIVPEGVSITMEDIIQNGIDNRKNQKDPNLIDFDREAAELEGFRKTQKRLTDPSTKVGAINLSIAPPGEEGSDYKRKFFDVFILREDERGRYIQAIRYLSVSEIADYQEKLSPLKTFDKTPTAADFLRDPIELDGVFEDPSEVQTYLNGGIKALRAQRLAEINRLLEPFRLSYINSLIANPNAIFEHHLRINAILNEADNIQTALEINDKRLIREMRDFASFAPLHMIEQRVGVSGRQEVRTVMDVPCPGSSGGYDIGGLSPITSSPYSVSEFSNLTSKSLMTDAEKAKADPKLCKCGGESPHFHCPGEKEGKPCDNKIVVGRGISECPECGEGKKC